MGLAIIEIVVDTMSTWAEKINAGFTKTDANAEEILVLTGKEAQNEQDISTNAGNIADLQTGAGEADALLEFISVAPTGDDAGVTFTGTGAQPLKNVVIGARDENPELCVGGDTTVESMVILQTDDDVNFVDKTSIFASDSGSSAGMFASVTSGETTYFGGDFKYGGLKAKIETAGVGLHDNLVTEIWLGDTLGWAPIRYMAVNSTFDPFSRTNQRADNLATLDGVSEQWHFDYDPWVQFGESTEWELKEINGHTLYWGRMRLTSNVTTVPVVQQFKLGTDRVELEPSGIFYFGKARGRRTLQGGMALALKNNDMSAKDADVPYAPALTLKPKYNKFENGFTDAFMVSYSLEEGIDTSIALNFEFTYFGTTNEVGKEVDFEVSVVQESDGFVYDGTHGTADIYSQTVTLPDNSADERQTVSFYLDISHLTPADAVIVNCSRKGATDTYGGNIIVTRVMPQAYFWKG